MFTDTIFSTEEIKALKSAIEKFNEEPELIHDDEVTFFKEWLLSFKAPPPPKKKQEPIPEFKQKQKEPEPPVEEKNIDIEEEIEEEEDFEIVEDFVIPKDQRDVIDESTQLYGNLKIEPSENDIEEAIDAKQRGMQHLSNNNYKEALKELTFAIQKNPTSAILLSNRATIYLKMNKPNACIKDALLALDINPDSAKSMRCLGFGYRLIGEYELAHKFLSTANTIDFDDEVTDMIKELQPIVDKIRQKGRNKILKEQKLDYEKRKKAQEERQKLYEQQKAKEKEQQPPSAEENAGMDDLFSKLQNNPDLMNKFMKPKVQEAFKNFQDNPDSINNITDPEILEVINSLSSLFEKK